MIPIEVQREIETQLELKIQGSSSLGGGCIHNAQKVQTNKGLFFLKYNALSSFHNFEVESKGLDLLVPNCTFTIPKVQLLGKGDKYAFLLMEFIQQNSPSQNYWEDFGRKLADLHHHTRPQFGLDYDNYIGSLEQPNGLREAWISFFVECRIQPKLQQAVDQGSMPKGLIASFDKLFHRLDHFFPEEAPSLLHGDLWGGNILADSQGQAAIFDPAVYYGHREMELAFMTMFDRQPSAFYEAYQDQRALESDWESRFEVYNLYPLLVHVILFGQSYLGAIKRTLKRFV